MKKLIIPFIIASCLILQAQYFPKITPNPPIYIAFLWHMHQPIYWPYESISDTEKNHRYPFSVIDIHNQRWGPYTSWPRDAIQKGINHNLPHFGAQVSFSGSLIENLNNLEKHGNQNFYHWKSHWIEAKSKTTSLGNPRLDMVGFGYHHPLMGLIDYFDIRAQIQAHKKIMSQNFPGTYSKGFFPPENAFSNHMIEALVDEGIEWVLVDNIHFERASEGYPYNSGGNIYEPNLADALNPNPHDWVSLNGLWAPTPVSVKWAHQPHYIEYINPTNGNKSRMIAVPSSRYLGNEDGRGGFGALNYEHVMSQFEKYNTDSKHPILIVLHHDGDNYGGGTESYYNHNFNRFVQWLLGNKDRFVCTTVQDYLEMFPPREDDVIFSEAGSWSGADNGDPEFKKWNGDPDPYTGYSPDRNSWAVITAAKNIVLSTYNNAPNNPNTKKALEYLMNAQTSCYWYWDNTQNGLWDAHPTRAANLAMKSALSVIANTIDTLGPTIYFPQREPYNPGSTEWGTPQSSNFIVWTYVFDINGLKEVTLKYRMDLDDKNSPSNEDNETYIGGADVTPWVAKPMNAHYIDPQTNPPPLHIAHEYRAKISGIENRLLDYYIEAIDNFGNINRSPIMHVWVGEERI